MRGLAFAVLVAAAASSAGSGAQVARAVPGSKEARDPAIVTVYPVAHARGLMVTTGGWAYCLQVQALARHAGYTLACGRYYRDGYTGLGLRSRRKLDWGNPAYLASFAAKIEALHREVGGRLLLIGVSYSGFGVATLASHHVELHPDRVVVIDSYLDLVARRNALPSSHETAREIDAETGGSQAVLQQRSVDVSGLAALVRDGSQLTVIWSVSQSEQREFAGATCDRSANAGVLEELATTLDSPVTAWVTHSRHGHDLWDSGRAIVAGRIPGQRVTLRPAAPIPANAVCASR